MGRHKKKVSKLLGNLDWAMEPTVMRDAIAVILFILGLVILLGIFGLAGSFGHFFLRTSTDLWGILGYIVPLIFIFYSIALILPDRFSIKPTTVVGTILTMIFLPALIHPLGGSIGSGIRNLFVSFLGIYAALLFLFGLTAVSLLITFNKSLKSVWARIGHGNEEGVRINEPRASVFATLQNRMPQSSVITSGNGAPWHFPSTDLLDNSSGKATSGNINKNVEIIQKTLEDFGMKVAMGDVNVGPTVTQYTLKPADGVKLNQITARANDLALSLAQHPIRIEAPIPGKSAVGIEIPNKEKATVCLKEVMEDEKFKASKSNLTFGLGRDVSGASVTADLKKMPHLLIAGATNSGKSVCVNAMIVSLLYQNSPDDLRLILVDPKRVEFTHYNGIPHLLCPVVFDVDKTVSALRWAVSEMDRRFRLLQESSRRNIEAYNQSPTAGKLPYIVIFIDELADLMVQAGNEVEGTIVRLAQMARAVGIHLVVATQRPSVDIITGLIKANITNRIAFSVASQVDSRTILDLSGAEKLLGNGDMLYLSNEIGKPKRIQGVLITDKEVDKVTNFLKQESAPQYDETILSYHGSIEQRGHHGGGGELSSSDELYDDAKEIVVMAGKASASLLQRRLRVGYARAARLLDMMEEDGAIGPAEGAKPRDVLIDQISLDHEKSSARMPMNQSFSAPTQQSNQPQSDYQNNQNYQNYPQQNYPPAAPQTPDQSGPKPSLDDSNEVEDLGEYRK